MAFCHTQGHVWQHIGMLGLKSVADHVPKAVGTFQNGTVTGRDCPTEGSTTVCRTIPNLTQVMPGIVIDPRACKRVNFFGTKVPGPRRPQVFLCRCKGTVHPSLETKHAVQHGS